MVTLHSDIPSAAESYVGDPGECRKIHFHSYTKGTISQQCHHMHFMMLSENHSVQQNTGPNCHESTSKRTTRNTCDTPEKMVQGDNTDRYY